MILFLLALWSKTFQRRKVFLWAGTLVLLVFSNSNLVNVVLNLYEDKPPKLEHYDIGIVLGGFVGLNGETSRAEFYRSGDRALQVLQLYKTGRIKKILISGGSIDDTLPEEKEANVFAKYLKEVGVPDSAMLIEDRSRNTIENAQNSLSLIARQYPEAKVLVVTSATHIPRTRRIFERLGRQDLSYFPADKRAGIVGWWPSTNMPNADALTSWEILMKEWIGYIVDPLRIKLH